MIFYYAPATGFGQIARGVGICRALRKMGAACTICAPTSARWIVEQEGFPWKPAGHWHPQAEARIYDLLPKFPRQYLKNAPGLDVLVWRPKAESRQLFEFPYNLILGTCENVELSAFAQNAGATAVGRVLPRDLAELDPTVAAQWWGNTPTPQVLVYQAGFNDSEIQILIDQVSQARVPYRVVSPYPDLPGVERYWPVIELLPAIYLAITGGGWQSRVECLATGVRQIAVPFPRTTDRQFATNLDIEHALLQPAPSMPPQWFDGARRAAQEIISCLT